MTQCNILFNPEDSNLIRAKLLRALWRNNVDSFIKDLCNSSKRTKVRTVPNENDSDEAVATALTALDKVISDCLDSWDASHPNDKRKDKLLPKIREAIGIDPVTQEVTNEEDSELKNKVEIADQNTDNLNRHMAEFYGTAAYQIVKGLKEDFETTISSAAYWDVDSGLLVIQTNENLNDNIRRTKEKQFETLVRYLQSAFPDDNVITELSPKMYDNNGILDSPNYFRALRLFFNMVASSDTFKNDLQDAHIEHIKSTSRNNKTEAYRKLVQELLDKDAEFKKRMERKFGSEAGQSTRYLAFKSRLYAADHYSEYYGAVKKYIMEKYAPIMKKIENGSLLSVNDKKLQKTLAPYVEAIAEIERPLNDILDAANAYTILTHFDQLVKEVVGDQIDIDSNSFNIEVDLSNKYSYANDTTNQKRGFQTNESMDSSEFTAKFTKTVIGMIRLFDYKTGEYMFRRLDTTDLIIAASTVINAINTDQLSFNAGSEAINEAITRLKEAALLFHDRPVHYFKEILELFFEKQAKIRKPLVDYLSNRGSITDINLSVLKSVYDTVFNESNSNSFYNQSIDTASYDLVPAKSLIDEIAGYVDRNVNVQYLEFLYDFETGDVDVRAKKKFFNNKELYKLQVSINDFVNNETSLSKRQELQKKYNFRSTSDDTKNTTYTVTVGGQKFSLVVPNTLNAQLLGGNTNRERIKFTDDTRNELFAKINTIDLVSFRAKIEGENDLTENERLLSSVLQFIEDTTGIKILSSSTGLQILKVYKDTYSPIEGMKTFLEPLMRLAFRAAYVHNIYYNANNKPLLQYLSEVNDPIYDIYVKNNKSRLFTDKFHRLKYTVASYADDVLNQWTDADAILTGEASKATTKDKQGSQIPNCSIAKLGSKLHYYLAQQYGTPTEDLLFVKKRSLIVNTFHDLEGTSVQDVTKSVKAFSPGESFFHAIFIKFWGSFNKTGNVIIQPTAYSDKTTFLNWEIKTNIGDNVDLMTASEATILEKYKDTIGEMYQKVYRNTTDMLQKITAEWLRLNEQSLVERGVNIPSDYRDIMHLMTEKDLVDTAASLNYQVEKNKDYKIINDANGNQVVAVNELLQYNAELFTNPNSLAQELRREKLIFLNQLIDNNCVYQVLTGRDTIDMYTQSEIDKKATSRSPVLRTILNYFSNNTTGRRDYMEHWVDPETGRLILAKQGNRNIISVSDQHDLDENIVLNPLLDRYFLVDGFLSGNLRLSLTGSEINHKAGKNSPFTRARKAKTVEEWNRLPFALPLVAEIPEGTPTRRRKAVEADAVNQVIQDWNTISGALATSLDIDQLRRRLESGDITGSARALAALRALVNNTYIYNTNTSQNTQFKRNQIIPATLQYVGGNNIQGPPPSIKCAVILDEKAHVWNYKGDHEEDIDSCDGSARITAFQSIMENRALGGQGVGFDKKPIWHSYDTNNGTAFQAKFATYAITNERMRSSVKSTTNLHNLFKKMTNLQWDPNEKIDLTKSMYRGVINNAESYNTWISTVIFGGKRLFYVDKYGDIVEITSFNKSTDKSGNTVYYTSEKKNGEVTKKYHVFYDTNEETSVHLVYDSFEDAKKAISANQNGHTINSLYELHTALGGIYCTDAEGNFSEYNNEVVVNFMNNIGTKIVEGKAYSEQAAYDQSLKKYHIGYALNDTAVKNGAKNINPSSSWSDDTALHYFDVDTAGLGVQMNADHDVVNSELTEFSQVIAATAAYGFTFDQATEIYQGLARTAFQSSEKLLTATDEFLKSIGTADADREKAHSALYDVVGRIILVNGQIRDDVNLTDMIMDGVRRTFTNYNIHTNDPAKIPFSDPNIHTTFLSTLASVITKRSIKRKHPGSGNVIAPAYNTIQYFEIIDENGEITKIMPDSIIKKARGEYKADLLAYLKERKEYDKETHSITRYGKEHLVGDNISIEELEKTALLFDKKGEFSRYYTPEASLVKVNQHLIDVYLEDKQVEMPTYDDRSYFMPSDIVEVLDENGEVIETVDLDSLDKYYNFKDGFRATGEETGRTIYPEGCKYRISATHPHNLRPSLIRWRYRDNEGNERYMNYFDLSHVRDAYLNHEDTSSPTYRAKVQDSLHNIYAGRFVDANGATIDIIPGSLENTEAELVMSDMYKEVFGIGNESLNEVLEQGERYFEEQNKKLSPPVGTEYDVAFLRDNGKHVLLSIGSVEDSKGLSFNPFSNDKLSLNANNELIYMHEGRELYEVGRWVDVDDIHFNEDTGNYEDDKGVPINSKDKKRYRNSNGKVQKFYEFVQRYTIRSNGRRPTTLYKIADLSVFKEALGSDDDVAKIKQASIISKIFSNGDFKLVEINPNKNFSLNQKSNIRWALEGSTTKDRSVSRANKQAILRSNEIDNDIQDILREQLNALTKSIRTNNSTWMRLKEEFLQKEAHKKWVSFQDSLKFISSRIPAQTLQSFMAMKLVGWTTNSKNIAYVSHFQTYLQGSDYDIDKAYIMGQSYDSNSVYIKWSPYFDYSTLKTLEASKTLPVPKGIKITRDANGVDITNEINIIQGNTTYDGTNHRLSTDGKSEKEKIAFLNALGSALRKLEANGGVYAYRGKDEVELKRIELLFINHERYTPPASVAEGAYKNVASANIYAVSHDIRNRDQAYTAITVAQPRRAAEISPKGEQTDKLNMLNPLTKYMIQYQGLVGKNVVGITANGEKFWFNYFYYWTQALNSKDDEARRYLHFGTTLSRVKGRASNILKEATITHAPDLNARDERIKTILLDEFGATEDTLLYSYVDQAISQLLSAAADNAKELVLAKINANTDFTKMYLYLIMSGQNFNDIAAFMTCPISEFITTRAAANMFQESSTNNSPQEAVNAATGYVNSRFFLHGSIEEENENGERRRINKRSEVKRSLAGFLLGEENAKYRDVALVQLGLPLDTDISTLSVNELMKGIILASVALSDDNLDLTKEFGGSDDLEINSYMRYCQDLIFRLRKVKEAYNGSMKEMMDDANEFKKIFDLSTEITNISVGYLSLNQGLATDKVGSVKKINSMRRVVTNREDVLGIRDYELFPTDTKDNEAAEAAMQRIVTLIQTNNLGPVPTNEEELKEWQRKVDIYGMTDEAIREALRNAHDAGIINKFDPIRAIMDNDYKQVAKEYVHVIKGTANVIDMMDKIPHYKQIMQCLKADLVADHYLCAKSRIISELANLGEAVTDQSIRGMLRYVDQRNTRDFLKEICTEPISVHCDVVGFDAYFSTVPAVNSFDLTRAEGIAGFKHFMESEFMEYLKANYGNNTLVKHLTKTVSEGRPVIITDIDLLTPNTSTSSRVAYDEILRGISEFENIAYEGDERYSIADLFQLYNLIVNSNQYGGERLTTMFEACIKPDSIIQRFLKFEANRDYDFLREAEYDLVDYQINAAPVVSAYSERFHFEPFIKVKDPIYDYILKRYNSENNIYTEYPLFAALSDASITPEERDERRANYAEYFPFEMPKYEEKMAIVKAINFEGELDNNMRQQLKDIIRNLSISGKVLIFKDC